jgi:hypothetical protein
MAAAHDPVPRSRVYAVVSYAFETMTATKYQHHNVEKPGDGVYCFDCVGMANWALSLGAARSVGGWLGDGTIQVWPDDAGAPHRISWRVGRPPVPTPIVIARALA